MRIYTAFVLEPLEPVKMHTCTEHQKTEVKAERISRLQSCSLSPGKSYAGSTSDLGQG
jgi:hypothetical protein